MSNEKLKKKTKNIKFLLLKTLTKYTRLLQILYEHYKNLMKFNRYLLFLFLFKAFKLHA